MTTAKKTGGNLHITSDLEYHKYAALVVHMDIDRYMRKGEKTGGQHVTKANENFVKVCSEYLDGPNGLKKCEEKYRRANKDIKIPDDYSSSYEKFLYQPACFVTFGHTDNLAITALDDLNPAFYLQSSWQVPARQSSLAFCPTLESLGLEKVYKQNGKWRGYFCELDDICTPDGETGGVPNLPFLKDRPLVAVTYYKMNNMAVLGPGLLMQQAAFKVMGEVIKDTIKEKLSKNHKKYADLMSPTDIQSFCCAFLDPQDWSDIATVMLCRNYSVIMTVIKALRSITFEQLYKKEKPHLEKAIDCLGLHKKVEKYCDENIPDRLRVPDCPSVPDRHFDNNHVIWSTFTTLGLAHKALKEGEQSADSASPYSYNGVAIADTKLNIHCGHLSAVMKFAKGKYKAKTLPKPPKIGHPDKIAWCIVGHDDYLYEQFIKAEEHFESDQAAKLGEIICQIKKELNVENKKQDEYFLHVIESRTDLRIPVVVFYDEDPIKGHYDLPTILTGINAKLFDKGGLLDIDLLTRTIRKIRLPDPLSRSISNLFNDYARYLSDPFLFDGVLDLLDTFIATQRFLSKTLPEKIGKYANTDSDCRIFVSDIDIEYLAGLVELLQDALAHRTQFTFRDAEKWNATIDVKGNGLDRILNAVDTPLKCVLRTLRRVMNKYTAEIEEIDRNTIDEENKKKIGGACRISTELRSFSKRLYFNLAPEVYLASVDLNVAHLFRPSALCIHLHEGGHLIYRLMLQKGKISLSHNYRNNARYKQLGDIDKENYENELKERHEDIFAEMLVYRFVFDCDYKTYLRNLMVSYSFDPISYDSDYESRFLRLLEVLIRGFLVTDPCRMQQKKEGRCIEYKSKNRDKIVEIAQERFWDLARDAGPFFMEYSSLWKIDDTKFKQYIYEKLENAYEDSFEDICNLWGGVQEIYDDTCKGNESNITIDRFGTDPPDELFRKQVDENIKEGLGNGRPIIRVLCEIPGRNGNLSEADRLINPFYLIRRLLNKYIVGLYSKIEIDEFNVCLGRDPDKGFPDFDLRKSRLGSTGKWHSQLIDRNLSGLFSADPEARGDYIRKRITFIKTLWDISSNLRGRRMMEILSKI